MSTEFYNRNWRMPKSSNSSKVSNYSMSFDGSSEYIDAGATNFGTIFSVSLWFKTTNTGKVILGNDTANNYLFYIESTSKIWVNFGSGNYHIFTISPTLNFNTFYSLIFVRNGANGELFLNGNSQGTSTNLGSNDFTFQYIGKESTLYFSGQLDHVAIFDYALSASQITALYGNSTDGVGNPMSISPKPKFYYPIGDYAAFNGSEYLVNNGALQDYVFDITGSGQLIDLGGSNLWSNILVGTNRTGLATVSYWIKGPFVGYNAFWNMGSVFSAPHYAYRVGTTQRINVTFGDANIYRRFDMPTGVDLDTSNWIHVVILYPAGTVTDSSGTAAGNGNRDIELYVNGQSCVVNYETGASGAGGSWGGNSKGIINISNNQLTERSNVQIWNSVLTAPEITTLYNNGTPYIGTQPQSSNLQGWWKLDASATFDGSNWSIPDDSSNSNTGTSSGMTAANLVQSTLNITTPYSRYALDFDGNNDFITTGYSYDAAVNNNLTLSFWYKSTTAGNFIFPLSIKTDGGLYNSSIVMVYNKKLLIQDRTGWVFGSTIINDGNWHNIVVTAAYSGNTTNGTNLNMYIDGNSTADLSSSTMDSGANSYLNGTLYFGNFNGASNFCVCTLSNVAVWESILTSTQITEIYNEGKPSNLNNHSAYSNLVSWWQLGENSSFDGTNWTVLDEKGTNNGTSANMTEADLVDGVGTSANGLSGGMGGADNIIGDAPYSTANAVSYGMGVDAKSTSVPS